MKLFKKYSINPLNIGKIFLLFWLISLFFSVRFVFPTVFSYKTGLFSDFTSISLYLSDILLFTTWFWILPRGRDFYHVVEKLIPFILWAFLVFLMTFNPNWPLCLFFLGKILELIVAYGTIVIFFQETSIKTIFLPLFVSLSSIQALLSFNQFLLQHPIGLFKLGEQQIYPNSWGVAKIIVDGTSFIRGYGTFPHPNVLSAFLVAGIFITIYLFCMANKFWAKALLGALIIINILGLTSTFSRGAFFALTIGLVIFFGQAWLTKHWDSDKTGVLILILLSVFLSFALFNKFLVTRATISDQATLKRGVYNKIGWSMIKDKPVFGQGIGQSVLHMEQYSNPKLTAWEIQPIHNYYLLSAAELGIPGALILIWIFLFHLKMIVYKIKTDFSTYDLILTALLVSFLIMMLFDHYFYTLEQTQFLLWIILGIIATKKVPSREVAEGGSLKLNT